MGLRDDIQTELAAAFDDELSDVIVNIKLRRNSTVGEYNPLTGTRQPYIKNYLSRGFFSAYPEKKIDGVKIITGDEKLTIIANEITITPLINDSVIIDDGTEYLVVTVKSTMGGGSIPITYKLQVRKNAAKV